jgi:hypothetical protein
VRSLTAITTVRERAKNPLIVSQVLETVKELEDKGLEPSFNEILSKLSARRVLGFHRSLRKYLDLLVGANLLSLEYAKASHPNIRAKQVYRLADGKASMEAGERSILFHGLNWDLPSPRSLIVKTDLEALARAKVSGKKVYASLEDSIVQSLKVFSKRYPHTASEILFFATALLATQKVDVDYLLYRAKQEGIEKEVIGILKLIDETFTSRNPDVEDIFTLYKLREIYARQRRYLPKSIRERSIERKSRVKDLITPNQVVEYAGKQLGLRG